MKKLIFIIPLFISLGLMSQSTWVKYGLYRSTSTNALVLGNTQISCGAGIDDAEGAVQYSRESSFLWSFRYKRIGIMFDISSLPSNIVVDSCRIKLYSAGNYDIGIAISNRPNIKFEGLSCSHDNSYINPHTIPQSEVYTTTNTPFGYNTYTLRTFTKNYYYGDNYVSFGIVEYQHDYSSVVPIYGDDNYVYFYLNTIDVKPELTVYYHTNPTPPSPKKIKIIGVI